MPMIDLRDFEDSGFGWFAFVSSYDVHGVRNWS